MIPDHLNDKEFVNWADYQINDFTTTELEKELLGRLTATLGNEDFETALYEHDISTIAELDERLKQPTLDSFMQDHDVSKVELEELIALRVDGDTNTTKDLLDALKTHGIATPADIAQLVGLKERVLKVLEAE